MTTSCNGSPARLSDEDFLGFAFEMLRELKCMARERGFHQLSAALHVAEQAAGKLCALAERRRRQQQAATGRGRAAAAARAAS